MAVKIAFWNINTGKGSVKERKNAITDWCAWAQPDLLILEEVSEKLSDSVEKLTAMIAIARVATLDKNRKGSTKELWALKGLYQDFEGVQVRFPKLQSIRMGLKVTNSMHGFSIWGIHANASSSGGKKAVLSTDNYLKGSPKNLVGGDFNCGITWAQNKIANSTVSHPKSWENNNLKFSQWKKNFGKKINPTSNLHLQNLDVGLYEPIPSKNGVIDYVMCGSDRTVTPLANCKDESMWVEILKQFDHCPVMFSVT